jgi:hypothetical protein
MALGLAVLVAVSAGAPDLTARFSHALLAGAALLSLCLILVLTVLVPADRAATQAAVG